MSVVASQVPSVGQPWPEQGGIYIGARLIDGQVHHVIIPGGVEHDATDVEFENIDAAIKRAGEINGFSDWRAPAQQDLMLAYINAREHFDRDDWYWSSTPYGSRNAWAVDFEYGNVYVHDRYDEFRVRPFRSIIHSAL